MLGGSPLRLFRLTRAGAELVRARRPLATTAGRRLADRLIRAGAAHPRGQHGPFTPTDVTVIIPVKDDPAGLAATLAAVPGAMVIDDAAGRGPAAARNQGWRQAQTPLVAFVDAGCVPEAGWIEALLPHFADRGVAAVAPRVRSSAGDGLLARYERARSPLDLGDREGPVRPGSWVPYVPTAALVVRRDALAGAGGFDEAMRFGEDVDLLWRMHEHGHTIRFEPGGVVEHPPRTTFARWLRQRFDYGTAAAPLARRHGSAVAPLAMSRWTAAAWALAACGQPWAGGAVAAGAATPLRQQLEAAEVVRLTATGHAQAGLRLLEAARRSWWPITAAAALVSRRARRLALVSITPLVADWARDGRPVALPCYVGLRLADDLAYGAGVWAGCRRERSLDALRPTLS